MENSALSPLLGGIRKLLFSRRCRRLIKMVNCLRGGNDDKEGMEGAAAFLPDTWADFLSLLRSGRVSWDSSFTAAGRS